MIDRVALLRQGARLEGVTVAYNALEGVVAVAAGLAAGSVALTGFGIDSVIEVTSGALLWWRLRQPRERGAARGRTRDHRLRMALRDDPARLGVNAMVGWWWADPVAALGMLPLIVREGLEAWRGERIQPDVA